MHSFESKSVRFTVAGLAIAVLASMGVAIASESGTEAPASETPPVAAAPELTTVTGVIEIEDEGLLGDIRALRIVSEDESFRLASDEMSEELERYVGRSMTVTGEQKTDDEGNLVLAVTKYEPIES